MARGRLPRPWTIPRNINCRTVGINYVSTYRRTPSWDRTLPGLLRSVLPIIRTETDSINCHGITTTGPKEEMQKDAGPSQNPHSHIPTLERWRQSLTTRGEDQTRRLGPRDLVEKKKNITIGRMAGRPRRYPKPVSRPDPRCCQPLSSFMLLCVIFHIPFRR